MSMKNHLVDTVGQAIEQQYSGFHLALTGLVADSMTGAVPTSPRACALFADGTHRLQISTLTACAALLDSALDDMIDVAMSDARADLDDEGVRNTLTAHIVPVRDEVLATLAAALHKDTITATKRYRDFSLRTQLLMVNQGYPYGRAVQSARIVEQQTPLSFTIKDSIGRKWKPSVFAGATVRAALQGTYADTFVRAAAELGQTQVVVHYADPAHEGHGQILALTDASTHPSYFAMRDELFHPNSGALLAVEA